MNPQPFSRREFLKLASLSLAALAARLPQPAARGSYNPPVPVDGNVLSESQRLRLLEAARLFLAPDNASADQMARSIDFIEGQNEAASTMCGPLSIAILQAAGLLGAWARPHDFWLLNPRQNLQPVEYTFPIEKYWWHEFDEPVAQFDFRRFALIAGDMVYLHAGPGDTFEHVLIVNRVDEDGRPHSVTNYFTHDGTIIEERALYDPAQPGIGQFADWANRDIRNTLGNTGSGGFRVWRVRNGSSLQPAAGEANAALQAGLDAVFGAAGGSWYAAVKRSGGPTLYQYNPYEPFHPASTIKVPIALAFYHWLEGEPVVDWETYLQQSGVGGRSYSQLMQAMIVESEEDATQTLVDFLKPAALLELWQGWGFKYTRVDPRRSSATEIVAALDGLYRGKWVSAASRAQLLDLMAAYTVNDDTRLGRLRGGLPAGSAFFNKRGSLVDWPTVVGDSAIFRLGGEGSRDVFIASLHGVGKGAAGYEELEATLDAAVSVVGEFLQRVAAG
jgi:hypothetical protein